MGMLEAAYWKFLSISKPVRNNSLSYLKGLMISFKNLVFPYSIVSVSIKMIFSSYNLADNKVFKPSNLTFSFSG